MTNRIGSHFTFTPLQSERVAELNAAISKEVAARVVKEKLARLESRLDRPRRDLDLYDNAKRKRRSLIHFLDLWKAEKEIKRLRLKASDTSEPVSPPAEPVIWLHATESFALVEHHRTTPGSPNAPPAEMVLERTSGNLTLN